MLHISRVRRNCGLCIQVKFSTNTWINYNDHCNSFITLTISDIASSTIWKAGGTGNITSPPSLNMFPASVGYREALVIRWHRVKDYGGWHWPQGSAFTSPRSLERNRRDTGLDWRAASSLNIITINRGVPQWTSMGTAKYWHSPARERMIGPNVNTS